MTKLTPNVGQATWLVLALAMLLVVILSPQRVAAPGAVHGSESAAMNEVLRNRFDTPWQHVSVGVVSGLPFRADTDSGRAIIRQLVAAIEGSPNVRGVVSPASTLDTMLVGADGTTAVLLVGLQRVDPRSLDSLRLRAEQSRAALHAKAQNLSVRWTGQDHFVRELRDAGVAEMQRAELRALPVTLAIVVWAFGSVALAAISASVALIVVVVSMGVTTLLAGVLPVSSLVMVVATVVGIALSIDYMLYLNWINRTSDSVQHGKRTVLTAALLVSLAFAALVVSPTGELRGAAMGGAIVAMVAGFAAVTLSPPVARIKATVRGSPRWIHWGNLVGRRPLLFLLIGLTPMIGLSWSATRARLETPLDKWLPETIESESALRTLVASGRGALVGAARVVVELPEETSILSPAGWTALQRITRAMQSVPSAASFRSINSIGTGELVVAQHVIPPAVRSALISRDGRAALVDVLPRTRHGRDPSARLVHELRALDSDRISGLEGTRILVGGLPAYALDYAQAAKAALPWIAGAVSLVTWLVVAAAMRAPIAATKAVLLNLLVATASIGATVLVYQEGIGPDWLSPPRGSILPTVPLLAFGAAFGISIDYELFLLAAVRDRWQRGDDASNAAARGMAAVGPLISRAAAVMICLFLALAVSSLEPLAMVGFTLGVAVLLDATLVRMIVAPALMRIAGDWNWWPGVRPTS